MKLSTRARYGARALAELALAYPDGTVPVKEIAERQNISAKYLEQIMTALKLAGFITATRGMHGGYSLAQPPEEITLSDVYHVLEGSSAPVDCLEDPQSCPREECCPTRQTWREVQESIERVLKNTTVRDLADRMRESSDSPPMYQI